jgi:hypothetical protein
MDYGIHLLRTNAERLGTGESRHGARRGFHLSVCILVRSDGISVSRSNQEQALNLIFETAGLAFSDFRMAQRTKELARNHKTALRIFSIRAVFMTP